MRTLALSGGGIRALVFLPILEYIEQQTGKPCQVLFDGFAGSSTGAIVALALAKKNPLSAAAITQLYLDNAAKIFPKPWYAFLDNVWGLKADRYPVGGLEIMLSKVFGAERLDTGLARPVAITTFNATSFQEIALTELENWEIWEAARASSAAPTYFEPFIQQHDDLLHAYVDGGCCANAPDLVAIDRWGMAHGGGQMMLSLGTGQQKEGWPPSELKQLGELRWASKVIDIMNDGVTRQAVQQASGMFPTGSYLRLDPALPSGLGNLDETNPTKLQAMVALGQQMVAEKKAAIDAFIARLMAK